MCVHKGGGRQVASPPLLKEEKMRLIVGDTYDYRKELRAMGAQWTKKYRGWNVPRTEEIDQFIEEHPEFDVLVLDTIEKLRERAQEVADAKADKLLERARKRREKAEELQKPLNDMRGDIAFFTQPNINSSAGRSFTRQRERMYDKYHKSFELENEAQELEERAESLRCVAIRGDAERARNEKREKLMEQLEVGMKVESFYHHGSTYTIVKKNRKTVRIQNDENPNRVFSIDPLSFKRWWKDEGTD
jgi:hypothetical protein